MHSKKKIISRVDAYHGSSYLTMALTGITDDHEGFHLPEGLVDYVSCPNPYRRPTGMAIDAYCDLLIAEL